jgi:tetraacyldisaccharide 4'-kinase
LLDILYGEVARARRRYYLRRPHLRRRLTAPVISVGNLTVGGNSKTPLAAEIARMLIEMGERPSILSRGYARQTFEEGVVVVSDGRSVLADQARSGDEPQLLARQVPGAAVLVCPIRYLSGRLAETRLGCTVHVLDDGFQHFELWRDVDLLVAPDPDDHVRLLPFGRFREPLDAAAAAHALLVEKSASGIETTKAIDVAPLPSFEFTRGIAEAIDKKPAFAFAGIARPDRFFRDLEGAGWHLTARRAFRDHHPYSGDDLVELFKTADVSGAEVLLTTEKDFVRIGTSGHRLPIVAIPLETTIAPSFRPWLSERLQACRGESGVVNREGRT